jgi:enoyl-[acyl-carrier protein] reductase II
MNNLCKLLNIQFPIIQGGMGNISNAPLTAAVSKAGGLGTVGAGTMMPDEVESIITEVKKRTDKPFAVNIALTVSPYAKEIVELVIKHRVPVVSLSAGNPAPLVPYFHDHGVKVITVVGSVKHAMKAESAGSDIIVGEGYEAAGINSPFETTTLTLIPQLVQAVSVPVVAAGGIGNGRGLAAMLALGAQGVQMGTRFIATKEAPFADIYKKKILDADDVSTMIVGRSVGRVRRVLKAPYTEQLLQKEKKGMSLEEFNEKTSETFHKIGALEGNEEKGYMNSGQIAGLIKDLPTVEEVIQTMMKEAEQASTTLFTLFQYMRD